MPKNAPEKIGSVLRVPLSQLHPHPQNPFAVRDDPAMQELKESVSQNGVLVPAIARPRAEGGYELIAGHRRKYACEQAGQDSMPVIVLNLNDDEAVIQLVDSNIQREDILPSERARAYKMKMDAIKRQGARTDLTSPNVSAKFRSDDSVGEKDGISGDTVRNYEIFNLNRPGDFTGHSLSVSDIVALKQDGVVSYHYCDSIGFKELPDFQKENYLKTAEMSTEDDYGMIDGIINNGKQPTVAYLEQQAKSGQPISLMDLADAVYREKKPSVLEKLKDQPQQPQRKSKPRKSKEQEI